MSSSTPQNRPVQTGPGPGPGKEIDPTANVLALVDAAVTRINDIHDISLRRMDDLRVSETAHMKELMALQSEFNDKLREAEAKRIDAIRAVDVNAVSVANERATQQATVLANQVAASAEALRALVAATAATQAQQLAQLTSQLTDRLSSLEKSSYQGQGKNAIADPQLDTLFKEMRNLRDGDAGRKGGSAMWTLVVSSVIALVAMSSPNHLACSCASEWQPTLTSSAV